MGEVILVFKCVEIGDALEIVWTLSKSEFETEVCFIIFDGIL